MTDNKQDDYQQYHNQLNQVIQTLNRASQNDPNVSQALKQLHEIDEEMRRQKAA